MSSRCNDGVFDYIEDPPVVAVPTIESEISNTALFQSSEGQDSGISYLGEVFVCTICVETDVAVLDRALIPECNHSFCLDCLLSWATIRVVCPNCKAPFTSLFIHRSQDGDVLQGPWTRTLEPPWRLENVTFIQNSSWVALREIHSPQHDIEASFSLPPLRPDSPRSYATGPSSSAAPHYLHEEVEDELEDRFWQEEEKQYDRLMRGTRVISNRRFGPKGYIAAGHMRAKPRPPQRPNKLDESSGAGSSQAHARMTQKCEPRTAAKGSAPGSGRKKKVKKKSRAGIAAAAAAQAVVEAEASRASPSTLACSSTEMDGHAAEKLFPALGSETRDGDEALHE